MISRTLCIGLVLLVWPLAGQESEASAKQEPEDQAPRRRLSFGVGRRPTLRLGNWFRADFRVKLQTDFRGFSPPQVTDEGRFDFHRLRLVMSGQAWRDFEYEIEYETRPTNHPWRDVFVNYRRIRRVQIKGGRFKIPFGRDQISGVTDLDFVYRSLLGDYISPARETGVMVHGRIFNRGLSYEAGVFRHDGDNATNKNLERTGGTTLAGRLTGRPLQFLGLPSMLKSVELGAAFTACGVPEGVNSLRLHTVSDSTLFSRIFVNGRRYRAGTELVWDPGPFSIKGEYAEAREERLAQGLRAEDLPDVLARAWYLSGTYALVRREQGRRRLYPQALRLDGRTGTVELAARYEMMRMGSAEHPGRPSRSSRAGNLLGNSDRVWTLGVNWYLNRYAKIQGNAIHEQAEDTQRAPIAGRRTYWMWAARLQFAL
jgi:phosphate-selective porin